MSSHYRLAILADIHGNGPAFDAVLEDLENQRPLDRIVVAGDITSGPAQESVLNRLFELDALLVRGNGEDMLARMASGTAPGYVYTLRQFSVARWSLAHLSPASITRIQAMPEQAVLALPGAQPLRVVHGSPRSVNELVYSDQGSLDEILELVEEPVIVFGHTHTPWLARREGRLALNPGAVSFPEDRFIGAQYALLDWDGSQWQVDHRRVTYDTRATRSEYIQSGFLETGPLARVFLWELESGEEHMPAFFALARQIARSAGFDGLPYFPDEIWLEAERAFDWHGSWT